MKFRVVSDLHIEFMDWAYTQNKNKFDIAVPHNDEDKDTVLILAGDIASGSRKRCPLEVELDEFQILCKRFKFVIYINGNHEFYRGKFFGTIKKQFEAANTNGIENIYFLDNDYIEIEGQRIVGSTLWSDIPPHLEFIIAQGMNDYNHITYDGKGYINGEYCDKYRSLRVFDTVKKYQENEKFLKDTVKEGDIVVTHHSPSFMSVAPQFNLNQRDKDFNYAYHNTLDEFIMDRKPKVWIHGHTHVSLDYMIDDTRIICNPRGYQPQGYSKSENYDFDPQFSFEV